MDDDVDTILFDSVFDAVFDLVDHARCTGDFSECEQMLGWIVQDGVVDQLPIEVPLYAIRLTGTVRDQIQGWDLAVLAVEAYLVRRDHGHATELLWGLR